ncbi:MAG: hypothetical protein IJI73_04595 [Kiritimatiellae bacterium]|nr:hypothetical protein [Kiritimatiellia bacterium]
MIDSVHTPAESAGGGLPAARIGRFLAIALALASAPLAFAGPAFTMRIDDNHSASDWLRVADIFERRGVKVSFAVVPAALSEEQGRCLKKLSDRGHLIMDHLPNHAFYKATYHDRAAFDRVKSKPFVQEADEKEMKVLFKCEVDPAHPENRRFRAGVKGGILTFADPSAKKIVYCRFVGLKGRDGVYGLKPKGDAFEVLDMWKRPLAEKIDMDDCEVVVYSPAATQPCDDVLRELAGISRERFDHFGLPRPTIWVRPGGWEPGVDWKSLERVYGREFGYIGADSHVNARQGENRWSTGYDKMVFFDQGKDYTPEGLVDEIQKSLAAGKHHVRLSHMWAMNLSGGMKEWFEKTDRFAGLLADRKVPTQTMAELLEARFGRPSAKRK